MFDLIGGLLWLGGGIFLGVYFKDTIMKLYLGSEGFANSLQTKINTLRSTLGGKK